MAEEKSAKEAAVRRPRLAPAKAPARRAREADLAAALRANLVRRKADLARRDVRGGEASEAEPSDTGNDAAKPRR